MADNGASRKSVDRRKPCDCSYGGCQIEALFVRKICPEWKGHLPTQSTAGRTIFCSFPYDKTWRTVYMHEKQKVGSAKMVPV